MTGRTFRIRKCMLCFQIICISWENYDCIEKTFGIKLIFFLAIFKFLMSALDAQQDFMSMKCNFLSMLDQKIRVFYKKFDKVNNNNNNNNIYLKSLRSENHTPHYYWLNQSK